MDNRKQLNVRMDDDILVAIDDVRAMVRPIPSTSAVVRDAILAYREAIKKKIAREREQASSRNVDDKSIAH